MSGSLRGTRRANIAYEKEERDEIIGNIVLAEWELFQAVQNVGRRADCQDMPNTFSAMRRAQFDSWPDEALDSYADDLADTIQAGRNPVAEKYAYMMESTHPQEFEAIRDSVPEVPAEKRALIEQIVNIELGWADRLAAAYPHFAGRRRPVRSSEDTPEVTSIETYARGELSTYSERTLRALLDHYRALADDGVNLQARAYGYPSLTAADEAIAKGTMSGQGLDPDIEVSFGCCGCCN